MVMDPFSSQLNLYYHGDSETGQAKKGINSAGRQIPRVTFGKVWRVLKTLNANRRLCLEWLWSKKKSSKDNGYGHLITDEEKRWITLVYILWHLTYYCSGVRKLYFIYSEETVKQLI